MPGWYYYHQIIYDDKVKVKLYEWVVECVEDINFVPINIWTQFLKPKINVIDISRAEFSLKQIQEDRFNIRENAPLTLKNPTGTNKPPNTSKSNTLHGGNITSIKKYFKVVHNTKKNTPQYRYKNK